MIKFNIKIKFNQSLVSADHHYPPLFHSAQRFALPIVHQENLYCSRTTKQKQNS